MMRIIKRKIENRFLWTLSDPCKECLVRPACKIPFQDPVEDGLHEECPEFHTYFMFFGLFFDKKEKLIQYLLDPYRRERYAGFVEGLD